MKVGKNKMSIKSQTWMHPGQEQTLDELLALAPQRGWVILSVDRVNNRLLVGEEEEVVG